MNFNELKQIINTPILKENLDNARDWLVISCYTAQRVSDFLRFSSDNVVKIEGNYFLDITQEKTGKPVQIPLVDEVMDILKKRNGEFPAMFSNNIESVLYSR